MTSFRGDSAFTTWLQHASVLVSIQQRRFVRESSTILERPATLADVDRALRLTMTAAPADDPDNTPSR